MNYIFKLLTCALFCYVIGTFNPSYLISKIKGFDIRKAGSGNAGGSNALITMGKRIGIICMILDIIKAYFAVSVSMHLLPNDPVIPAIATTSVILGHMFPAAMGFKGGKGLACLGGSLLAYNPVLAMIFLGIELVLVFVVDYIVVVPVTVSITYPFVFYYFERSIPATGILLIATVVMIYKHIPNFKRIKEGKEAHFSFLWNRDKEIDRVKDNSTAEEYEALQVKKKAKKKKKGETPEINAELVNEVLDNIETVIKEEHK